MHFLSIIIIMALGFVFFSSLIYSIFLFSTIGNKIKVNKIKSKNFKQLMKEKEEFRKENHHEWITFPYKGKEVLVCKHTGWCAELDGFVNKIYIESHLKTLEVKKMAEDLKQKTILDICKEKNIDKKDVEEILERIYNAKKEVYLDFMKDNIREMQNGQFKK